MKTAHVLEQLPLWVEGDLTEGELATIQAHFAQCPTCFEASKNLEASQAWLKETDTPPFTLEDRRQLRLQVMAKIQRNPLRQCPGAVQFFRIRPLLLTAAAVGLFLILKGLQRGHPAPPVMVAGNAPLQAPPVQSEPRAMPADLTPKTHSRSARQNTPADSTVVPMTPESPLSRIEFQTSNPNIRIIWLARAEGVPTEPTPSPDRLVDPL